MGEGVYPGSPTWTWTKEITNYTAYTFTVTTRDFAGNLGAAANAGPVTPPGTLAERIAAAASGDTIFLYADEAITGTIDIGKDITLVSDSATDVRTLSFGQTGRMFTVSAHGSLTLADNVTLAGISGNKAAQGGGVLVYSNGTFTKSGGTIYGSDESVTSFRNTASSYNNGYVAYDYNRNRCRSKTLDDTTAGDISAANWNQ